MTSLTKKLEDLQKKNENVRNICILAHVDHGKTTLADSLIASNGIISSRLAGKLRYLDDREEEQQRGITMKSSAISLQYLDPESAINYLINLMDSPGHVDFGSEVSTAVRLCDGALVVVDVVEGVCPQTQAVLRQAWLEKLKPILVLNKLDRLITELKYSPMEAYLHLQQVLEQVNAVTGSLYSAEVMEKTAQQTQSNITENKEGEITYDWSSGLGNEDDSKLYFSPDQGNVVFCSAQDGWAFRIHHFAKLFSKKLGIREEVLRKTLWGDYYVSMKAKKIMKGAQPKSKKPLFVQFILENIWSLYTNVLEIKDDEKIEKITKSLNLKITPRDVRLGKSDSKTYLKTICSQWLPLSDAIFSSICQHVPNPTEMLEERVENLMCGTNKSFTSLPKQTQDLKQDFLNCSPESNSVIVLVSKMVAVDSKLLPQNKSRPFTKIELEQRREAAKLKYLTANNAETIEKNMDENTQKTDDTITSETKNEDKQNLPGQEFVAFARVFSGTLKIGARLFVLGPKHDPGLFENKQNLTNEELLTLSPYVSLVEVNNLYLWMGRDLHQVNEAPAGAIIGIGGLEDHVLNSATLCSNVMCPPFNALSHDVAPIIRVAVDPKYLADMDILVEGLRLLNQSDPCVQVIVQETGEHVIVAAGEVHLQRCLSDLRERFAKIEINASEPIVPFRETIIPRPKVDMRNELIGNQDKNIMQKWVVKEKENVNGVSGELELLNTKKSTNTKEGIICLQTSNKLCSLTTRAIPLPPEISKLLEDHSDDIKVLMKIESLFKEIFQQKRRKRMISTSSSTGDNAEGESELNLPEENNNTEEQEIILSVLSQLQVQELTLEKLRKFKEQLETTFTSNGRRKWKNTTNQIWSFGPRGNGPNLLVNKIEDYNRPSIWQCIENQVKISDDVESEISNYRECDHSIVSGFQLASLSGPLCEEPMQGVCFFVEKWDFLSPDDSNSKSSSGQNKISDNNISKNSGLGNIKSDKIVNFKEENITPETTKPDRHFYGPLSGQLISTSKDAFRKSFQAQPQRLMAAMYTCDIQATAEVLGKVYAVLGRREGRVVSEEMREGTSSFNIVATLPVAESFGFAEEIRKKTSGLASPQLVFSHWEVVSSDPFWVPTTEEEIQHFGEKSDVENQGAKYMNSVRRRKGLFIEQKTVEHAEKQRTLTKNK